MRKIYRVSFFVLMLLAAGCGRESLHFGEEETKDAAIKLICGAEPEANCLARLCENGEECAVIKALSEKAVFDFVATYAECAGCAVGEFSPEQGIGKCVEYQVSKNLAGWVVDFWVSEQCDFRYGSPGESRVQVVVNAETFEIENISPSIEYVKDAQYCQTNEDCLLLSGSGVAVIGCANYLYAPLNQAGYYPGEECACIANQCREKE